MKRMIFDKEESKNLINMLRSLDHDNHVIAFETLKNVDFKNYTGELLVLYKFSGHPMSYWEENCSVAAKALKKIIGEDPKGLTSPRVLSFITEHKGSKSSVELFMEFFVRDMTRMLEQIGYPINSFDITINIKEDGQATESK
jgi:hypothetical protein